MQADTRKRSSVTLGLARVTLGPSTSPSETFLSLRVEHRPAAVSCAHDSCAIKFRGFSIATEEISSRGIEVRGRVCIARPDIEQELRQYDGRFRAFFTFELDVTRFFVTLHGAVAVHEMKHRHHRLRRQSLIRMIRDVVLHRRRMSCHFYRLLFPNSVRIFNPSFLAVVVLDRELDLQAFFVLQAMDELRQLLLVHGVRHIPARW